MPDYAIEKTQPTTYLSDTGDVVNGIAVYIRLLEFDEVHTFDVPKLDPKLIEGRANEILENRKALQDLGG